jgi:hypothetical protein
MTTPRVTEIHANMPGAHTKYAAHVRTGVMHAVPNDWPDAREVYYPRDDVFVTALATDSKSRTTIDHPWFGITRVPASDLRDV